MTAAVAATTGCGGGSGQVPLARLAGNQEAYVGEEVTTSGRVEQQTNVDGSHYYVLTDPAQNLVILVPAGRARPYVGGDVSVRGRFGFNPRVGRLIRISSVTVAH